MDLFQRQLHLITLQSSNRCAFSEELQFTYLQATISEALISNDGFGYNVIQSYLQTTQVPMHFTTDSGAEAGCSELSFESLDPWPPVDKSLQFSWRQSWKPFTTCLRKVEKDTKLALCLNQDSQIVALTTLR